jgi:hypothetical protein
MRPLSQQVSQSPTLGHSLPDSRYSLLRRVAKSRVLCLTARSVRKKLPIISRQFAAKGDWLTADGQPPKALSMTKLPPLLHEGRRAHALFSTADASTHVQKGRVLQKKCGTPTLRTKRTTMPSNDLRQRAHGMPKTKIKLPRDLRYFAFPIPSAPQQKTFPAPSP